MSFIRTWALFTGSGREPDRPFDTGTGLTMALRAPHNLAVNPPTRDHGQTSAGAGTLHQELRAFETRLGELLMLLTQLQEENRALRQRLDVLTTERASLLQKNEQVRTRVEAMIGRLKAMEHGA